MKMIGCKEAKEISLCKLDKDNPGGAHPAAHVLIRKSLTKAPATPSETDPMADQAEITKAATAIAAAMVTKTLAMNEVTKAHYLALDAAAQPAFLEKSLEEMTKEAEAAKKAKDDAAAAAEIEKSGKTAKEVELEKRLGDQGTEIEALKNRLADADIQKRADAEFAGYPGGSVEVVKALKGFAGLSEDVRKAAEDGLKAKCEIAKQASRQFGPDNVVAFEKGAPMLAKIEKTAKERAATSGKSWQEEMAKMRNESAFAADFAKAAEEDDTGFAQAG